MFMQTEKYYAKNNIISKSRLFQTVSNQTRLLPV